MAQFTQGNYFQVSNYIFELKLRPITFVVYCYLKKCHNAEKGCFPSKETIAEACGVSKTSVDNALKELQEKGVIAVRHRFSGGHQQSNLYKLRDIQRVWMDRYFIPTADEEEAIKEEEAEHWAEEIVNSEAGF